MSPLKIVLDTNVYIQSLMRPGSFLDVLIRRAIVAHVVQLYTSEEILLELRQKAEGKFHLSPTESIEVVKICRALCTVVEPLRRVDIIARDPADNKILECALEARAAVIISADKDLLHLKEFQNIKIFHPADLKYLFPEAG